jgi:hypothetical protein
MRPRSLRWIGIALVTVGLACSPARSFAQTTRDTVPADYKAAVGLGLVGAELGAVLPAVFGFEPWWGYLLFPVVGAAGGAVAGYFAIDKPGHVEASVATLTAGMALVIPALVITLSLTAYDAESDIDDQARATPKPGAQLARAVRAQQLTAARRRARAGSGMVRLDGGELALAVPGIALTPTRAAEPWRVTGASVSLLSGQF